MVPPFAALGRAEATGAVLALGALAAVSGLLMHRFGSVPRTAAAPYGIVSLELAGTAARFAAILAAWAEADSRAVRRATVQVWLDFLFIPGYAGSLALLAGLGGRALGGAWAAPAFLLAWGQVAAGLLDMAENAGLLLGLYGRPTDRALKVVRWCAIGKFGLLGAGAPFALAGLAGGPSVRF